MRQRVVYGVLFEHGKINPKKADSFFSVEPFRFKDKNHTVVFNFQTMGGVKRDSLKKEAILFGLRRDLLFDIQSKAANHVNRLGNSIINPVYL